MEKEILSLKNIYRMLTVNDYPVYSMGVIGQKNKKGLTLVKFWQENLLYEFRSQHYGKLLWRSEGGRNRYISEICNRSERLQFYQEYTSEVLSAANQETILRQIVQFMDFLKEREYSFDSFMKRFPVLNVRFAKDDAHFTEGLTAFFRENTAKEKEFSGYGAQGQLFLVAWHLTFLMICALTGDQMQIPEVEKLCRIPEMDPIVLWTEYQRQEEQKETGVVWLTEKEGTLAERPMPKHRFFGREEELFNLCELVERGGKYLIAGEEGIGKTELLRQLLRLCIKERIADEIAIFSFERSSACEDEKFQILVQELMRPRKSKVLLLIDNLDEAQSGAAEAIRQVPVTVIASSELVHIPGFETYEIENLSISAGKLIFRDNYDKTLSLQDQQCLEKILENPKWRHVSKLRMLGQTANQEKWSVEELKHWLETEQSGL